MVFPSVLPLNHIRLVLIKCISKGIMGNVRIAKCKFWHSNFNICDMAQESFWAWKIFILPCSCMNCVGSNVNAIWIIYISCIIYWRNKWCIYVYGTVAHMVAHSSTQDFWLFCLCLSLFICLCLCTCICLCHCHLRMIVWHTWEHAHDVGPFWKIVSNVSFKTFLLPVQCQWWPDNAR